jgi:hypothetical protein
MLQLVGIGLGVVSCQISKINDEDMIVAAEALGFRILNNSLDYFSLFLHLTNTFSILILYISF